LNRIVH